MRQGGGVDPGAPDPLSGLLASSLHGLEVGFIALDSRDRVVQMNATASQITGWLEQQALGRDVAEILDAHEGPRADHPVLAPARCRLTTRQGLQRLVEWRRVTADPVMTAHAAGNVILLRDLSDLNEIEVGLHRLAAIVESSSDAIIGKTLDGVITSWNEAAHQLFGYPAEHAVGCKIDMLIPQDRRHEEQQILAALGRGERVPAFDTVRLTRDGRDVEVSLTVSPIRDAVGQIVGAAKIVRDISYRREAEQARMHTLQLEAENRRILDASRMKSQFLANMSHELRTPLNAVIGFADLLESGAVPHASPKHREFLGHIGRSGRHLLQLINDVLDLAKVESGKMSFYPERVDLRAMLDDVLAIQHTALLKKKLQARVVVVEELGEVMLDPARFKQVLFNLLSNAIKFTPDGGRIDLRVLQAGDSYFRLEVEDNGIGIAAEDLSRLFVEFQQLDTGTSKLHAGTGLGLALTRRLVREQGGEVGVRSLLGVGSVFHVILPRQPSAAGATEPGRVLVLESKPALQSAISRTLDHYGQGAEAAATADQALQQAQSHRFSGLTLDLALPDLPGLQTFSRIREHPHNRAATVLGLTMRAGQGATSFPVADLLHKPLQADEVIAALIRARLLEHAQPRVLVVDDDPQALALMQALLGSAGLAVELCPDATQALADLDRIEPHALILDLMMPGMDGFQVLHLLQQSPRWRTLPVFIWTSMILSESEYQQLAASAQAILGKGGGALDALLQRLRHWQDDAAGVPRSMRAEP